MEFEGAFTIEADDEFVWDRVSQPAVLMDCVPGAKEITRESETRYTGIVERSMAGVTVELEGAAELLEQHPPERLVASATGEDGRTNSRMDADLEIEITPDGDACEIDYVVDVAFSGRLASLGSRIVKRKVDSDIDAFLDNLRERIEAEAAERS